MPHPIGRPFVYFLVAGTLLAADVFLLPFLSATAATYNDLLLATLAFVFVPFIFLPSLVFQFEKRWIQERSAVAALRRTRWFAAIAIASLMAGVAVAWVSLPMILASRFGPPRPMTGSETERAIRAIGAWDKGNRGDLSVLLAQLTWRWLPNSSVNAALAEKVQSECGASGSLDYCFQGLRALFAAGAQTPDLAPVLVKLSERDTEVSATWRPTGFLIERGEVAHRYRSMLLDMLGILGPAADVSAHLELASRLSDREERSRWAAAGALARLDSADARRQATAFFAQSVPALVDGYRAQRSRRLRACLFLLRAELKDPAVGRLAASALGNDEVYVRSCGAFLLLTSGVAPDLAEENLLSAFEGERNHFTRDSIAAALEILATPRSRQALRGYTAWQPDRIQKITAGWHDRYFRLFGDLL
jgi:hypothetical protein